MQHYAVLEKQVGETPLQCMEKWRSTQPDLHNTPLAYAGRLDPMASGALLVLIGDECKKQTSYHNLDKAYTVDVLLGVNTDSGDVLGLPGSTQSAALDKQAIRSSATSLRGDITLPYPHYSSKTVAGKPLHTWTLEGRLDEITIPSKTSTIHHLTLRQVRTISGSDLYHYIQNKIETIPPVTETRKALGNDFRRPAIRAAWNHWQQTNHDKTFTLARIYCIASSGTYMRTVASVLGAQLDTPALAYHIHRNRLGHYKPFLGRFGIWTTRYRSTPRTF